MKKLIYSFSILALSAVSAVVFPGCKGDDGDDVNTSPSGPSISFVAGTGFVTDDAKLLVGGDTMVKILITHSKDIKSAKITFKVNGGTEAVYDSKDTTFPNNTTTVTWSVKLVANPNKGDIIEYIISATDKEATTNKKSIKITSTGPIFEYPDHIVGHKYGPEKGAFDFLLGDTISAINSNASDRDVVDQSTNSTTFAKSWGTDNGAQFIHSKASSPVLNKQYSQIKSEDDLKTLWNTYSGANAKSVITGIALGDLILVKINATRAGNGSPYYLVRVTDVIDDGATGKDDWIAFDYLH